jgi:hypothetical protein
VIAGIGKPNPTTEAQRHGDFIGILKLIYARVLPQLLKADFFSRFTADLKVCSTSPGYSNFGNALGLTFKIGEGLFQFPLGLRFFAGCKKGRAGR